MNKLTHVLLLIASYKMGRVRPWNPPFHFVIEPTNVCNFRCVFCPQSDPRHKDKRRQGYLSVENLKLFIDRIRQLGAGNKNISLTLDGEPTLNKDLPEFVRLTNESGLFPRFSSNAKNLYPPLVDKLVRSGDFLASIDFASDAGHYDNVRGGAGDFQAVLENLKYIVNTAAKNRSVKLELIDISHFSGVERGVSLRKMRSLFPYDLPGNISFRSREFNNFCGHLEINSGKRYALCPYPWTSFNVTWEGDVVPCCRDTEARTILGNVFKQTIQEIWHGDEYQQLRTNLVKKNIDRVAACRQCDLPWSGGTSRWRLTYMRSSLLTR